MKQITLLLTAIFVAVLLFTSCEEEEPVGGSESTTPERFMIDIPDAVSNAANLKSTSEDTLRGNDIYEHMRNFIAIGEESAIVVEQIIVALKFYHINQAMSLDYISDDDSRNKHMEVVESKTINGKTYDLFLTITDVESGDTGMQVAWNVDPIEGIAILNPFNLNRTEHDMYVDVMYQVEYSEVEFNGYDAHMVVSISGWPMPVSDIFGLDNLRMFVGKKGDIVELYGNSNHPNAIFFNPDKKGYDWAFVAKGDETNNIGVAEVGLPPYNYRTTDGIFSDYSVKNVLYDEIYWALEPITPEVLKPYLQSYIEEQYLAEANAPAYFAEAEGWIGSGENAPDMDGFTSDFIDLSGLTPYIPNDINNLEVIFIK